MGATDLEKDRKRNESGESSTSSDSVSKYIPTPPDGGWGWVIVVASFINHIIVDGVAFTFGIFYIEFMKFFESSKSETALVGSLLAGFYLMAGPIASALTNKFGCRVVCMAGSLISSLAFVLCTLSNSIQWMMVTYGCLGGFGFGLIYLPSIVSVSYYFEKRRALATGIAVCGAGVGCFIFAPAGRYLMQNYDWKNSMYVVAGVTLNSCICGMLMRPLDPPKKRPRSKNFFDRLREKLMRSDASRHESEADEDEEPPANMMERVQEAKLARVKALLEDEDGESDMGSCPNSRVNSLKRLDHVGVKSRNTSIVSATHEVIPKIIVEDDQEEEDEKAQMIKTEESSKEENSTGQQLPMNGSKTEHALLLANCEEMAGSKSANGLHLSVKTEDAKTKSLSTANVWGLNPHRPNIPPGVVKEDYARPLYRRDIFYSGSILHIQEFRSQPNVRQYVASITNIPNEPLPEKEGTFWKNIPIPKAAKDILKQMLDVTLLKDPVFMIACLGEIFGFIGLFVPFVFVAERAIKLDIPDTQAAFLLSVIGITNTIGRVVSGWLADFDWVNPLLLHNIMMILGGVACILNMFATTYVGMCLFCAFFGLCVATYISLTSIILCDLMGLERLTSAFGLLTMVRGVSSIAGPPIAGYVFELTQNYDTSFHVGGAMFIAAGSIYCILHLPYFSSRSHSKALKKAQAENLQEVNVIVKAPDFPPEDDVIKNGDIATASPFSDVDLGDGTTLTNKTTSVA